MAFPENWTEQDEINALEGIDAKKEDPSGLFTFDAFRQVMVEGNGWSPDKESTKLLYALFNLYIDEVETLMDYPFININSPDRMVTAYEDALGKANRSDFKTKDPESYNTIKEAYEKAQTLQAETKAKEMEEREAERKRYREDIERRAKELEEREKRAKEEQEKREREAREREEREKEEQAKANAPKEEKISDEEAAQRAEIERLMEEANKRAQEEERLKEEQAKQEQQQKELAAQAGANELNRQIREKWVFYEAYSRAYEISGKKIPDAAIVSQDLIDHYEETGVDVQVERENDNGEKYMDTMKKPLSMAGKSLNDIKPTDWTEKELEQIENVKTAVLGGQKLSADGKAAQKAEDERLEAEEKALPRMSVDQIKEMHIKVREMKAAGIDLTEFVQSPGYWDYCESKGYDHNNAEAPLQLALMSNLGPNACADLLKYNVNQFHDAMNALHDVEELNRIAQADTRKFGLCDSDAFAIGRWLNTMGDDIVRKNLNDDDVAAFDFEKALSMAGKDRDNLYGFEPETIGEAKQLYEENKEEFDRAFEAMSALGGRRALGPEILQQYKHDLTELNDGTGIFAGKDTLKKLNQFCHMLYKVKQTDEKMCKIGNDANPVYVAPLDDKTNLSNAHDQLKEGLIIDKLHDMLKSSMSSYNNSNEYKQIMTDLKELKTIVKADYESDQAAKEAYAQGLEKTLKDINLYRRHKAYDGIKQDVTLDKLVSVERIDKLLQSRYQSITGKEYKDPINSVGNAFNPEVEAKYGNGRNYVLALSFKKISGISRNKDTIEKNIQNAEKAPGRNSVNTRTNQQPKPQGRLSI